MVDCVNIEQDSIRNSDISSKKKMTVLLFSQHFQLFQERMLIRLHIVECENRQNSTSPRLLLESSENLQQSQVLKGSAAVCLSTLEPQ